MITLTIHESDNELMDGFPEYVSFDTDVPATVYYTLDGTDPDNNSLIAVGSVYLPTLSGTLEIRALAVAGDDESDVLEVVYENSSLDLSGARILGSEGIVVMRYDDAPADSLGVLADGSAAQEISVDSNDLDIKASRTNSGGEMITGGKTSRDFINFSRSNEVPRENASSNAGSPTFDPSANFIIIDGFTDEAKEKQVVKIVNRPYSTFGPVTNFYTERLGQKEPIVTGNYVRSFYNPKTKKYVSYYWESLESRWIRSEQIVEKKGLRIGSGAEKRFVYRWVQDRALSQLF